MKNRRRPYSCHIGFGIFLLRICVCLILPCSAVPSFASAPDETREREYLEHKKNGDSAGALDILRGWSADIADPALIEVMVFRIRELMAYPELYDRGLDALMLLRERPPSRSGFLRDRIDIAMNLLLLKKGELKAAKTILAGLSFLDFNLMGPFECRGPENFAAARCPEQGSGPVPSCSGRYGDDPWFHAEPDLTGSIDIDALNGDTAGSLYYFSRSLTADASGTYYLVLGKTGFADIWIDGSKVFSDRTRHCFDHDQYFIPVRLAAGAHRLLVKAGSSSDGIRLSARLVRADAITPVTGEAGFYPPVIASLVRKRDQGPADWFRAGYLLAESRRFNQDEPAAAGFLSRVPESHFLYAAACYYRASAGADSGAGDRFYAQSLKADPGNPEALRGLALGALRRGLPYEASPPIDLMAASGHAPCWYDECLALLCMKMGWDEEALRHAVELKRSPVPSAGLRVEALIFRSRGDAFHETLALERIMALDRYDRSVFLSLAASYEKKGDAESAVQLLQHAVALFPNDTVFKLRLAGLAQGRGGPAAALPYLSAALNAAPGNAAILKALGIAYLNLGKNDAAEHYLRMALRRDPGDGMTRLNLEILESDRAGAGRPHR